jgi:hypothetical protein
MTKFNVIIIAAMAIMLNACGPSEQEIRDKIAREQVVKDSSEHAAQLERIRQESLTAQLIQYKSQLEAEETKMNDAKQFQLMRSEEEKLQQIQEIKRNIEILKINIDKTERELKDPTITRDNTAMNKVRQDSIDIAMFQDSMAAVAAAARN